MIVITRELAAACAKLWLDSANVQLSLAKQMNEQGKHTEALTHCKWAEQALDNMDKIKAAIAQDEAKLTSGKMFEAVEESFDVVCLPDAQTRKHLDIALDYASYDKASVVFAQIYPEKNGCIRIIGANFTWPFNMWFGSIVNTWRERKGISLQDYVNGK